jgi:hypothetical protein
MSVLLEIGAQLESAALRARTVIREAAGLGGPAWTAAANRAAEIREEAHRAAREGLTVHRLSPRQLQLLLLALGEQVLELANWCEADDAEDRYHTALQSLEAAGSMIAEAEDAERDAPPRSFAGRRAAEAA